VPLNSVEIERIKVLVVDDHTLFAEGTVSLLSLNPRILTVGIAGNEIECINLVGETVPDVVLLDINLPDISGIDLIDKIRKVQQGVKIIMLTGQNPKGYITKAKAKGANGFLLKDCSIKELTHAILRAHQGDCYFSERLKNFCQSRNSAKNLHMPMESETPCEPFTTRETEIMELIAKGLHNKEIASALCIKVRTVDFHISNILFKLDVSSRLEAVLIFKRDK